MVFTGVSLTFSYLVESTHRARNRTRELLSGRAERRARASHPLRRGEAESRAAGTRARAARPAARADRRTVGSRDAGAGGRGAGAADADHGGAPSYAVFYAFDARAQRLVVLAHAGAEPTFSPPTAPARHRQRRRRSAAAVSPARGSRCGSRIAVATARCSHASRWRRTASIPTRSCCCRSTRRAGSCTGSWSSPTARAVPSGASSGSSSPWSPGRRRRPSTGRGSSTPSTARASGSRVSPRWPQVVNAQLDRDATFHALGRWLVAAPGRLVLLAGAKRAGAPVSARADVTEEAGRWRDRSTRAPRWDRVLAGAGRRSCIRPIRVGSRTDAKRARSTRTPSRRSSPTDPEGLTTSDGGAAAPRAVALLAVLVIGLDRRRDALRQPTT